MSVKVNLDAVASAGDVGRQGGADVLASSIDPIRAAGLLHQGCAVAVLDCHVVVAWVLNIKRRELDRNNQSLLDLDDIQLPQIIRIVARVVWWADNTFDEEFESQDYFKFQVFYSLTFSPTAVSRTKSRLP